MATNQHRQKILKRIYFGLNLIALLSFVITTGLIVKQIIILTRWEKQICEFRFTSYTGNSRQRTAFANSRCGEKNVTTQVNKIAYLFGGNHRGEPLTVYFSSNGGDTGVLVYQHIITYLGVIIFIFVCWRHFRKNILQAIHDTKNDTR